MASAATTTMATHSDMPDKKQNESQSAPKDRLGICALSVSSWLFLVCIYNLTYIAFNFSENECISKGIYIVFIIMNSLELLESMIVLCNIVAIWEMIHDKGAIITAHVKKGSRTIETYDIDSLIEMLRCTLGLQVCQLSIEAVLSFYTWSIFFPSNCNGYWLSTAPNAIFYIIRMTYSWIAVVFVCLCILRLCFTCCTCWFIKINKEINDVV